jgi:hypothetical protein
VSADRDKVTAAVESLTNEGSRAFRASAIARRIPSSTVEAITPTLIDMVRNGHLRLRFDLVCPDNGRTIKTFGEEAALCRSARHGPATGAQVRSRS